MFFNLLKICFSQKNELTLSQIVFKQNQREKE